MNTDLKNKLWAMIDENPNEVLGLCSDLIKINSENPPGEMEIITDFICTFLEKYNIEYEIIRPEPNIPNIVARIGSKDGKKLVLNGHSDVVPVGKIEGWDFDPFSGEIKDGILYGRGASDMKAGLGGLLYSLMVIARENIKLQGEVILTIVPDEEVSGLNGTKWLVENKIAAGDACIIAEPTCHYNCEIGQKGSTWLKIWAKGIPAHGSLSPFAGENAIERLLKVIENIKKIKDIQVNLPEDVKAVMVRSKELAKEKMLKQKGAEYVLDHISFNLGRISGGTKVNMVPDYAEAEIDMRIPLGVTTDMVAEKVAFLIEESGVPGIDFSFSWFSNPNHTDAKAEIVEKVAENVKDVMGIELQRTYQWASSDARFFRYAGIPTLQYGPANLEGIHAYNETVQTQEVIDCTKVYIGAILDFLGVEA
jgi:succinyl-diaminopimelate desuccinylase